MKLPQGFDVQVCAYVTDGNNFRAMSEIMKKPDLNDSREFSPEAFFKEYDPDLFLEKMKEELSKSIPRSLMNPDNLRYMTDEEMAEMKQRKIEEAEEEIEEKNQPTPPSAMMVINGEQINNDWLENFLKDIGINRSPD